MTDDANFSGEFEKIKQDYLNALPEKIQEITRAIDALKQQVAEGPLGELRHHVHKLAGNAGSFGFQKATELCKAWDVKLKEMVDQYSEEKVKQMVPELDGFLSQLKQLLEKPQ